MLINLHFGASPSPAAGGGPVAARLRECHERIRRFCAMAVRLAGAAPAVKPAEVVDAARQLQRYFATALPLHVADEDGTVLPRLLAADAGPEVREALERMEREHRDIDAALPALLDAWDALQHEPAQLAARARTLLAASVRLEEALLAHLELEERVILPALDAQVPLAEQAPMVEEMKARRALAPAGGA
ncbi:hemerythrin domain-containing protein [Aggregicoccus sp. 17bor-14]|uniref:hemerythrin domain-containing protein n=1 Tax=Myxococcaceae TaxID=31 RepID=UPI00129CB5CE|nr:MULTISPECIES: hemerythrin domain-containing protein [Myxococcaceae]MBF5045739.1 hemerythrin domain-containing protein [Simulacricoccus sp. 17bor-14]MRI91475.1 hemerythrin domain-containing protein [Aggregicoccus sp. 17bor-14]